MSIPPRKTYDQSTPNLRIASLQPSITLTLAALNSLDALCAHTKYCLEVLPELASRSLPILHDSWTTTSDELTAVKPDLVIASVPYRLESLAAILKSSLPVLALAPRTLADVLHDTRLIARQVDRTAQAEALIETFQQTLESTQNTGANLPKPAVYCEEWGKPLIHSQPWVAELAAVAGGTFLGTPGAQTTPETIAAADPDILLFAWCGTGDRVPLDRVIAQRNWHHLRAVRNARVYCIPDEYLNTPAIPSLTQGLACLSAAIHPDHFTAAPRLIRLAR
ncbi:ABC transporter substrate-binding protein [Edaphobacter bradus]|uniref:ABC transporter substrate-binding protein n=1 Tax=Edaphobacter bradus TaxID=2259016 RepID=UPI0021DFC7EE|nr:ABC transporter substrate-binding protein [Edaphobacter bradus]